MTSEDFDDHAGEPTTFEERPRRRRVWVGVLVLVVFAGFGIGMWYAYTEGIRYGSESVAPVITADAKPIKVRPEAPGGMEVPYRDTLVYGKIAPGPAKEEEAQLGPGPEEPIITRRPKPMPELAQPESSTLPPVATPPATTETANEDIPSTPGAKPPPPVVAESGAAETASVDGSTQQGAEFDLSPFRLQLASMRSPAAAAGAWDALIGKHYDVLADLEPVIQKIDLGEDKGVYYRVQAGPIATEAEGKRLCAVLTQRNVGCLVVRR
ncbi:MAG: hypothetical protein GY791_06650 [Alphaproteobacteria bacterium]|nr:hypothetical protein [Alphaproteobacteria bacterium]